MFENIPLFLCEGSREKFINTKFEWEHVTSPYLLTWHDVKRQESLVAEREYARQKRIEETSSCNISAVKQLRKQSSDDLKATELNIINSNNGVNWLERGLLCHVTGSRESTKNKCKALCVKQNQDFHKSDNLSWKGGGNNLEQWPRNFIAKYEIGEILLDKACHTILRCRDKRSGQEHIMNVIVKRNASNTADIMEGIDIMKRYHHRNIEKIVSHIDNKDKIYLIMETANGMTLTDYVENYKPLRETECAKFLHDLSDALFYLHSNGIVHRAVRPDNVLINSEGDTKIPKLANFEHAAKMKEASSRSACGCGSDLLKAPECGTDLENGPEVDIWNLGTMAYYTLLGYPPCCPTKFDSAIWNKQISESVKDLIENMLHEDRKERYTARDVLCHPWILSGGKEPTLDPESAQMKKLRQKRMNELDAQLKNIRSSIE